jgi:hypothetical protein
MNANRPKRAYNRRVEPAPPQSHPEVVLAVMDEAIAPSVARPDMRAEPRPAMREESSRDRAARRAAEIMGHLPDENEAVDPYDVSELQPDGYAYQWKVKTVLGQELPQRQLQQAKTGWEAVPAGRHPELMPHGWKGSAIEREGLILMERPTVIEEEMQRRERKEARDLVRGNAEKLSGVPEGQFARVDGKGRPTAKLSKTYSPVDIPSDAG